MKLPITTVLALSRTCASARPDAPPRLIPMGCNFDGGVTWLAVGKTAAGPEPGSIRVEVPDVDLERVEATISPTSVDMLMPYGPGPVVGPIGVAEIAIAPRRVDGTRNGNIVTIRFDAANPSPPDFSNAGAIAYVLVLHNKSSGCRRAP
jgi:hypothetical protein